MTVTGVGGAIFPNEGGIGTTSSGIGVAPTGITRDQQFTNLSESFDANVGLPDGVLSPVAYPGKKLLYCQSIADVPPDAPVISHEGVGYRNRSGQTWPAFHWGWAVEP